MQIQAKPTAYNGYLFRSRLEARWAVFFDALNIKYHYEYQDFVLQDGVRYLPDFYLPDFQGGTYAEVKPEFDDVSRRKCEMLCELTRKTVFLLEGPPDYICTRCLSWNDGVDFDIGVGIWEWIGIFCADQAAGENRMYAEPGYENEDLSIPDEYIDCLGGTFIRAINQSRAARFENF